MPDDEREGGGRGLREGSKGKREGGRRQEGGRAPEAHSGATWCLQGPLQLLVVLDCVTHCDLPLTGCKPAPCSLLSHPFHSQTPCPFINATFLPWCLITYCHCVVNLLYAGVLPSFICYSTSSARHLTRPYVHRVNRLTCLESSDCLP